jgi:cytochrome c-type biogenesis protein CcmH
MDIKIAVNFAQSLFQNNQQQFTPLSLKIYNSVLQSNQNQPDALAMLAMNAFMSHDYKSAIAYWERLLKLAPQKKRRGKCNTESNCPSTTKRERNRKTTHTRRVK